MESPSLDFILYIQRLQTRSQIIDKLDSELDLIYSQLTKPVEPTNAIPGVRAQLARGAFGPRAAEGRPSHLDTMYGLILTTICIPRCARK